MRWLGMGYVCEVGAGGRVCVGVAGWQECLLGDADELARALGMRNAKVHARVGLHAAFVAFAAGGGALAGVGGGRLGLRVGVGAWCVRGCAGAVGAESAHCCAFAHAEKAARGTTLAGRALPHGVANADGGVVGSRRVGGPRRRRNGRHHHHFLLF